ncbi:MAG: lytic transglycosylase domain-containing protein [bacterium]|nr:lytic transglycosylase domain-containing protein [bacterium]
MVLQNRVLALGCGVVFFVILSGMATADLYVYSDADGVIHVSHDKKGKDNMTLISTYREPSKRAVSRDFSLYLPKYQQEIEQASSKYGVEPELIRAVILAESDFDPYAISYAGALGLMQLIPETAERMGVDDPFNPRQNIDGGTRYLGKLREMFDDLQLSVAAYHAGENRVARHGGIPPIPATRQYVQRVLKYYEKFRSLSTEASNKVYQVFTTDGSVMITTSPSPSLGR